MDAPPFVAIGVADDDGSPAGDSLRTSVCNGAATVTMRTCIEPTGGAALDHVQRSSESSAACTSTLARTTTAQRFDHRCRCGDAPTTQDDAAPGSGEAGLRRVGATRVSTAHCHLPSGRGPSLTLGNRSHRMPLVRGAGVAVSFELPGSSLPPMRLLRRLLAVVVAAASLAAHAQPSDCPPLASPLTPEQVEAGMKTAKDHGFLWRVSRDGHASYLYGTIHVARLAWLFPGPTVLEAIRDSDTVALEPDVLDAEIQRRLQLAMSSNASGSAPTAPLPPALAERLRRRAAAECVSPETIAAMPAELQAASLTVLAARRDGLDPAYSVDMMLSGFAHGARKTVVSLETPESQMQALKVPDRAQALDYLRDALDDLDAGRTRPMLNRLASIWATGDHDQLAHYTDWCDCTRTPTERLVMKRLLDDRNPALADKIDALHRSGRNVFAAVGSLHMVGPSGLPALLAARGYKVERGDFETEPAPPKAQ